MFYLPTDAIAGVPYDELEIAERCGSFEGDGWRVRADGRRFRAHTTLTVVRSTEGVLVGFARVTRDLTVTDLLNESARVVPTAELCEAALRPVLDIIAIGYFALDADRRLTSVNAGAARILGAPISQLLGRPLRECLGELDRAHFLARLPDRLTAEGRTEFMTYDAHAGRWMLIHAYPELDLTRVLLRDVTDEVEDGRRSPTAKP